MPHYQLTCTSCARTFEVDKNYGTAYCPHCQVINMVVDATPIDLEQQAEQPQQLPPPIPPEPAIPSPMSPQEQPTAPEPLVQPTPTMPAQVPHMPPAPVAPPDTQEVDEPVYRTPQEAVDSYFRWYSIQGYATNPFDITTGFEGTDIDQAIRSRFVRYTYTIVRVEHVVNNIRMVLVKLRYQSMRQAVATIGQQIQQEGEQPTAQQIAQLLDGNPHMVDVPIHLHAYRNLSGNWEISMRDERQQQLLQLALTANIYSEVEDQDMEWYSQEESLEEVVRTSPYRPTIKLMIRILIACLIALVSFMMGC